MKLTPGVVPGMTEVAFPMGVVPVEKPPEAEEEVSVAEPDVVPSEGVAEGPGIEVWMVMLIVLVSVCVNVTVELLVVSVQVVVQTMVELPTVTGDPGVLELGDPVTKVCQQVDTSMIGGY